MIKRSWITRLLSLTTAAVLALSCAFFATACNTQSEEDLIRAEATEFFDAFKNPTKENMAPYLEGNEEMLKEMEEYGIDIYEFLGNCYKNFDYTIDAVTVEGEKATIDVTLTNVDLEKAMTAAQEQLSSLSEDELMAMLDDENGFEKMMQEYFKIFYEKIGETKETTTNSAKLELEKKDGEWVPVEESIDEVVSSMLGGLEGAVG